MAPSEGRHNNWIFLGPRRIFCPWVSDTKICRLGAWGERGVDGIGVGGVGEDGVEVGEVVELLPAEVERVVALELWRKVVGGVDSICWSDGGGLLDICV